MKSPKIQYILKNGTWTTRQGQRTLLVHDDTLESARRRLAVHYRLNPKNGIMVPSGKHLTYKQILEILS